MFGSRRPDAAYWQLYLLRVPPEQRSIASGLTGIPPRTFELCRLRYQFPRKMFAVF